ncbi:uncharacterized protein LOC124169012 [Ischnura elegans]|uniref:uncharacterized protein LOC124169012 n=1 Tax=Ischnura elegans TaxID=197161 RepID=UPI001ED86A8A|nr:uncharacterized protein LOC124169012 [Ischnura elegans]
METSSKKSEIMRLTLKKSRLQLQEAALKEILAIAEKQLTAVEVEGYQLDSYARMMAHAEDRESDFESSEPEPQPDLEPQVLTEEELNKTELKLDCRLDDMLGGRYHVEEYEDEDDDEDEDGKEFLSL